MRRKPKTPPAYPILFLPAEFLQKNKLPVTAALQERYEESFYYFLPQKGYFRGEALAT